VGGLLSDALRYRPSSRAAGALRDECEDRFFAPTYEPYLECGRQISPASGPKLATRSYSRSVTRGTYLLNLGAVPYLEAWDLQRSLAAAVSQGAIPDTVLLLEHPPVITLGRRAEPGELHVPEGAEVDIVETDRGGKSTYHGPGQLVCYPIFDLKRHGEDVQRYCRDLEEALIRTIGALGVEATRIDGLTGIWLTEPPRKIASIGIHIAKWVTTHGYALNVDLDPAPFTQWITACGLEDTAFTTIARELGRPVTVDEVRPHAAAALEEIFDLAFEELPAEDGHGLWPQPIHATLQQPLAKPVPDAAPAGAAQGVEQVVSRG
jgi:lipoyl(octanoyl) transferase